MCGIKLKRVSALLGLLSVLFFLPLQSLCYADVILTDEEATELMETIQEAQKDLQQVKSELTESKKESQELKTDLNRAKSDYAEQKKSYEKQLTEERQRANIAWYATIVNAVVSFVLAVAVLVSLL